MLLVLCLPALLGNNVLSFISIGGKAMMDIEDYTVSNILLPVGSLIYVLFSTTRYGWGWDNYMNEVNTGNGLKIPAWFKVYMKFILPLIIIAVLIMSIF